MVEREFESGSAKKEQRLRRLKAYCQAFHGMETADSANQRSSRNAEAADSSNQASGETAEAADSSDQESGK